MEFLYRGKTWGRGGFQFPGLYEYIRKTKEKLSQPLRVPAYATAGEAEHIHVISEKVKKEPYLKRTKFNQMVRNLNREFTDVHAVGYSENQTLYKVCLFVTEKIADTVPMIFLYSTAKPGYIYNAFALDHQDKVWIYISNQFFLEHGMMKEEELCYLVGHELGHAQCHHSTITSEHEQSSSDMEYSADRAGLIACAEWILKNNPEYTMEQVAQKAVLYAASFLLKITSASVCEKGTIKWVDFDYESIQNTIEGIFKGASKMSASIGTHPHSRHRVMAMVHFSQSQMFYRCLNKEPEKYKDLLSDQQLQNIMQYQLKDS